MENPAPRQRKCERRRRERNFCAVFPGIISISLFDVFAVWTGIFCFGPADFSIARTNGPADFFFILLLSENVIHTLSGNILHQSRIIPTLIPSIRSFVLFNRMITECTLQFTKKDCTNIDVRTNVYQTSLEINSERKRERKKEMLACPYHKLTGMINKFTNAR